MGLLSGLKSLGVKVLNGFVKVAECTLEVCSNVAQYCADKCQAAAQKIREWTVPDNKPKDPVPKPVKEHYEAIARDAARIVRDKFPNGVKSACEQCNSEEIVQRVVELANEAAVCFGIQNPPEVVVFTPENPEDTFNVYGAYNHRENKLKLNLPMIVSREAELLHEQISTVFHELIHANQHRAVEAWCNGKSVEKYGYTEEYVATLANNLVNYIRPEENYEGYTKQPVEAEAYFGESSIMRRYNNKNESL